MEVLVSMYIWHTLTRRSHCGPQRTFYSSSQRSRGRSTKSICSNVSVSLTDTTTPCPRTICGNAHISPRMGAYREAIDTEARGRDATYSDIEALESYEDLCAFFKIGVPVQEGCIRVDDFEATPDWENPCTVFNCEDKKDKFGDYECHHDVVELNGHRCMVNLDNLCSKAKNSDQVVGGTIEFRAHAGTLDFMTIRSWVLLLSVLMRYSTMAPTAEFLQLLLNGLHRTFGLRKLLEALGCPEEVVNFYCTEDGSIGVLPCGDTRSLVTPATTLALFEYNDDSYDGRSSPTALASTIRDKDNADEYGILADDICPPPPQADIEPLLQHALTQILAEKGVAVAAGEASMDLARERVLAGLAEKYALECEELEDLSMLGKLSLEDGKEDQ